MTKYEIMLKKEKERERDSAIGWSLVGIGFIVVVITLGVATAKGAWF